MGDIAKELLKMVIKYLIAFIPIFVAFFFIYQNSKLEREIKSLNGELSRQSLISDNAYTSISIFDRISGATIDAKQQNTLDAQGAKKDVKAILVGNDCAPVTAPDSLINRMRQYKD
ncbi:hypothetical protein [Providencia rettgeri]|uniref:hypothetical protein n=1 Tax=Providencia rettgeri TaxID=587 RepID=UPI001B387191|nr:hypothetical protein [Providencia rettgeri]MBQ0314768.1 hypothetical protein [Providencia rettgeri]MBQ0322098.1 hypothetical protein [Providencia rettgeri]MBQ0348649.1 hypothetical protein [Providencia rettgeri]MBQ0404779.1 hypothetical protein [Providencia rettgeri]MCJ2225589.1 hypothetical protein [Providencia rettgeri]